MKQRTFYLKKGEPVQKVIETIQKENLIQDPEKSLFIIHEGLKSPGDIQQHLFALCNTFPGVRLTGCTSITNLEADTSIPEGTVLTLMTFEESDFYIYRFSQKSVSVREAARDFTKKLNLLQNVRGIMYLYSESEHKPEEFVSYLPKTYNQLPIFGMQAGADMHKPEETEVFCGRKSFYDSVILVVFCGENLHITTGTSFGWKPLGREMTVTGVKTNGMVTGIDYMSVVDMYYRYLHIPFDANMYSHICAFPLVKREGEYVTACLPTGLYKDGAQYGGRLKVGDKVSLSYARMEYLMEESLHLANRLIDFQPQALWGTICINRRIFLGNAMADREIDYYRQVNDQFISCSGFGEVLRDGSPLVFRNSTAVLAAFREGDKRPGSRSPLTDTLVGKMSEDQMLTDKLVVFLEETTRDLHQRMDVLKADAEHDRMTNLLNRTAIEMRLENAVVDTWQSDVTSLFLFDIDHFKTVNDTYGHIKGDEVLKRLAGRMHACLDGRALIGRWGGDEFMCVFPNHSAREAWEVAESLRRDIEATDFGLDYPLTISGGVTETRPETHNYQELYQEVDLALYYSKKEGKNRITLFSDRCHSAAIEIPEETDPVDKEKKRFFEKSPVPMLLYQQMKDHLEILAITDGFCKMVHSGREDLLRYLRSRSLSRVHPEDAGRVSITIKSLEKGKAASMIYRFLIEGEYHELLVNARMQLIGHGVTFVVMNMEDLTMQNLNLRKSYSQFMGMQEQNLYHDPITGLPNINYFNNFASGFMKEVYDQGNFPALILFDVVDMHAYNERFGNTRGNRFLQEVGHTIRSQFPSEFLVRYVDDSFIVITGQRDTSERIAAVRRMVQNQLTDGICSIRTGICYCHQETYDGAEALDKARWALTYAERQGIEFIQVYNREVEAFYQKREYIRSHLKEAIRNGWIEAYLQPQIRNLTGEICSFEALARWIDPERGIISPGEFIPILEESRQIYLLDLEIVRQAAALLRKGLDKGREIPGISVNLSRIDFQACHIFEEIEAIRKEYRLGPEHLYLEITESALAARPAYMKAVLNRFRAAGYEIWLDDFGSGYSSLNILKDYPVDLIKLDLAFLHSFEVNPQVSVIISHVVHMAKTMGIHTLCEGVETREEYDFLKEIGCEISQGFYFCRPVPVEKMHEYQSVGYLGAMEKADMSDYYDDVGMVDLLGNPWAELSFREPSPFATALLERMNDGRILLRQATAHMNKYIAQQGLSPEGLMAALNQEGDRRRDCLMKMMDSCEKYPERSLCLQLLGEPPLAMRMKYVSEYKERVMFVLGVE